jgi:hypothetical protein
MNFVVRDPVEFQKRFNTTVAQAKDSARNLAELFERLETLGEDCIGMKVSFGGRPFIVEREGDTFILVEDRRY